MSGTVSRYRFRLSPNALTNAFDGNFPPSTPTLVRSHRSASARARMYGMSAIARALLYKRVFADDATVSLLRANTGPLIAGILEEHLGNPGTRIDTEELHELMESDLLELRDAFDLGATTAKGYCDQWREAGYIVRRPSTSGRGETYELSTAGSEALQFLASLQRPHTTATESRLVSLMAAIRQLAIDTDPDTGRRVEALEAERTRIEDQISRIRAGEVAVLDNRRALERAEDILSQSSALPTDFARVRERFEALNHELRASLVASDELPGAVLDDVFRGVDLIESSDEGQTFAAFSALVRNPEQSAVLEGDLADLLGREFVESLTLQQRSTLRGLRREMVAGSREVQQVLTDFARGLRRYVYSREFRRDRVLQGLLTEALGSAVGAASAVRAYTAVGEPFQLPYMPMTSFGSLTLHDPSEFDAGEPLEEEVAGEADLAALLAKARETEIDFEELRANVTDVFEDDPQLSEVSVSMVLERFPATQGVASVVGLVALAATYGREVPDLMEVLAWRGLDGTDREAVVSAQVFTRPRWTEYVESGLVGRGTGGTRG